MAPPQRAPDYSNAKDVKELLDRIGEDVYKKAKKEAEPYTRELEGNLSLARIFKGELVGSKDPCELIEKYRSETNSGSKTKGDPCANRSQVRFSDEGRSQCTDHRIKCTKEGSVGGACAPFRRLHLCDRNLEKLTDRNTRNTHNLLAEVCLAAQFEGASLKTYHEKYEANYHDFGSTICTVLARSFADIGDIIRGKDLYLGYDEKEKERREKLEQNLKKIFGNIYEDLKRTRTWGRKNEKATKAEERYRNDGPHYYQLREDWWDANRHDVWKAMTCNADGAYFRPTCQDDRGGSIANNKCRCTKSKGANTDQVPTYFDYVPQYLRWFEEWAEDFCRKRKHKLKDAITNCRGHHEDSSHRYCSRNGYDCKETVRGEDKLVSHPECTNCSVVCTPFVEWIDNKEKEFIKQREKYDEEIEDKNKLETKIITSKGTINNLYVGEFYEKLKVSYGSVANFLKKLNEETTCTQVTKVEKETLNPVMFDKDKITETFSHKEYCDPCPLCGVKIKSPPWYPKDGGCEKNVIKNLDGKKNTKIDIIRKDKDGSNIVKKLEALCKKGEKNYDTWRCYYEEKNEDEEDSGKDYCILQNKQKDTKDRIIMPFDAFFSIWINNMLKDSIEWRRELDKCLKSNKNTCGKNKCTSDCKCFKAWVEQKEREWAEIEKHYEEEEFGQEVNPYGILEFNLKEYYFKNIENKYPNEKPVEEMKAIIDKNQENISNCTKENNSINDFLRREKEIDRECTNAHNECPKKPPPPPPSPINPAGGRSHTPARTEEVESEHSEDDDVEEEDAKDSHEVDGVVEESEKTQEPAPSPKDNVEVCEIVNGVLNVKTLQEACPTKYGSKAPTSWRCISDATSSTTGESGSRRHTRSTEKSGSSDSNGSICVPPRRRRLYIGPLIKWADETAKGSKSLEGSEGKGGSDSEAKRSPEGSTGNQNGDGRNTGDQGKEGTEASSTSSSVGDHLHPNGQMTSESSGKTASEKLRNAFIESAAVETFFLWHQYKQLHKTEDDTAGPKGLGYGSDSSEDAGPFTATSPVAGMSVATPLPGAIPGIGGVGMQGTGPPGGSGVLPGIDGALGQAGIFTSPTGLNGGSPPVLSGNGQVGDSFVGRGGLGGLKLDSGTNDGSPDSDLRSGNIPPDFLRQMFYTLGDYRDIFMGDTTANGALSEEQQKDMKTIKTAIEQHINSLKEAPSGKPVTPPGQQPSTSGLTRENLWQNFAKDIWHGMICALTYKDNSDIQAKSADGTNKLKQDPDVYEKFFGDKGTFEEKYTYQKAELKDENSVDGPKPTGVDSTINTPKLIDFVKIPPFFRYLEEWGENFCKKRTEKLKQIEKDCRGENGVQKTCSGDGEDCNEIVINKDGNLETFKCKSCADSCSSYRKWIERKKTEYEKQQKAYEQEKKFVTQSKAAESNDHDKEFCGTEGKCETAADFLNRLKTGPCKPNENGEDKKEEDEIDFKKPDVTFKPATNCKPCSKFKIDCNGSDCGGSVGKKGNCKNKTITKQDIENKTDGTDVVILVSDNSGNGIKDVLPECENADIFKGIKENKWKCRNVCGVDICTLKKTKNGQEINEHIIVKEFLKRWVENFLEDYNRIKHKILHCINNGNGKENECINGCKDKCECVSKWIEKKRDEWPKIRDRYFKEYNIQESDNSSPVRSFLEEGPFHNEVQKAIKPCKELRKFEDSIHCNGAASSQSGKLEKKNIIDCLLSQLQQKIGKCQSQPSGENPEKQCQNTPPLPDEEETEENTTNTAPEICKGVLNDETKKEEVQEETCDEPKKEVEKEEKKEESEDSEEPRPSTEGPDQASPDTVKPNTDEKAIEPPGQQKPAVKKGKTKPKKPVVPPKPPVDKTPALVTSTLAWSVGIGFVALTYWLLKKKTKSSVDMLRVLQIPQNDYGIPTKRSSNRYIPYSSAQYRGKRYIYIEGDSGTDSGYTDHYSDITSSYYSDITSSSESEYEEFDINDIYVPHAPKYKTLIEVVLEPSGKTQNDIPSDDIPTNKLKDIEWNMLKDDFISNMLQNEQPNDVPNDYTSANTPMNTQPNTLYFDKPEEKSFIMSIQDRNLLSGQEYNYDMLSSGNNELYSGIDTINGNNDLYSGIDPTSDNRDSYSDKNYPTSSNRGSYSDNRGSYSGTKDPISDNHHPYSGIDLINDSLNSGDHDIYDEILKRKENELFGTNHTKRTSNNSVAKNTNSDPLLNQLDLFHKWLDRHRNMCEKLKNDNERLAKLKEKWENETHSGNKNSNIPSNIPSSDIQTSDIPSGKLSDMHSGKLSGTPSDNNIHSSDIQTSDIPNGKISDIHSDNNIHSGKLSDIPSGKLSDIPSDNNKPNDVPHVLNTDVSIQIDMDKPNQVNDTYLDTYPDKYTVDNNPNLVGNNINLVGNINPVDSNTPNPNLVENQNPNLVGNQNPNHVQIQMSVKNTQMVEKNYPIGDVWGI
ncbi:erythrocyte membrane protein 1, EMP1 [Plasmodium reichenowi]|uniref:Erythrocyte membrane protein 1, EMP1 n=1 Tax=Plasmodium reichenowi TaxID=5854 RepID=A0A060RP05_PLARE|nr:erythrocyte membrane protein 1, EMP1 [Plasmodium reichenowi]